MKDLRDHYKVGDMVKYYMPDRKDVKPGEVIKVTKGTVRIKYSGYKLTLSKVKLPEFLDSLVIQPAP